MASNINSDAEYVESVMMSQSLLKPVDPRKERVRVLHEKERCLVMTTLKRQRK